MRTQNDTNTGMKTTWENKMKHKEAREKLKQKIDTLKAENKTKREKHFERLKKK